MLNGLDLFSGIGGISLALSPWVRTIAYCENDRFCQSVLLSRMRRRELSAAPIWDDVTTLLCGMLPRNEIDIIFGGFPCQDISCAGNGEGLEGKRSALFFQVIRLVRDLRPCFVFLENVPAITLRGLDRVLLEFTALGYDSRWTIVSAAEIGAPHFRERWFLLAHTNGARGRNEQITRQEFESKTDPLNNGKKRDVSYPKSERLEGWLKPEASWKALRLSGSGSGEEWPQGLPKPTICRTPNGLSNRVDRLRGLGNAVVPAQAREAFMRLSGMIPERKQ